MTASALTPVRRLPAPEWDPPYDDDVRWPATPGSAAGASARPPAADMMQGTLALAFVLPSGIAATPDAPPDLRLLPDRNAADLVDDEEFGPQPTPRHELPAPRAWAGRLVQATVEVLAGERPPSQLVRWTSAEVYDTLCGLLTPRTAARPGQLAGASASRPLVRSLHVSEPADGVAEIAALVRRGTRSFAVAVRLEGLDGRWQCTAFEVG